MGIKAGLWIDHKKATILTLTDDEGVIKVIVSKAEKQLRRSGASPLKGDYEARQVPKSDSRQKALTGHQNIYFESVVACIRNAEAILIFGPGEAKGELKKRLERENLGGRIAVVETVDKMTDNQIAAKVKKYFLK
jgi:hypothetical protein